MAMKAIFGVLIGIGAFISFDALWAWWIESRRIPKVLEQFEHGSTNIPIVTNGNYFERPKEEHLVKLLVGNEAKPGSFNLITGEHGTGKSTIVKHCCKEVGSGVLYVLVPSDPALFADKIGKTINYDFQHVSFWSQLRSKYFEKENRVSKSELNVVLDAISQASERFSEKHSRPAVLVIDNLTVLAKEDPATFTRLIRFAKEEADRRRLVVTFVSSEGHTPRKILELSESSRLAKIIEIGDLADNDAVRYLSERDVSDRCEEVLYYTGGRISLLNQAIDLINQKFSPQEIGKDFHAKVSKEFSKSHLLLPENPLELTERQRKAWNQIIKIYDSPMKYVQWLDFGRSVGLLSDDLLQENIFSYHPRDDTISFQSKPVELFVKQVIGDHGSEKRKLIHNVILKE
jgi:KaiC/GvpD/RAD55 family RecA-like ATPase